jgi:hypothetical protein
MALDHEKVTEPLTIRQRNSRSAVAIVYNSLSHDSKEIPPDLPDLIGSDDEGGEEGPHPIGPSPVNHPLHFHRYDSPLTVHDDNRIYRIGQMLYFRRGDLLHALNASKRGPHRPSQALLEEHAIRMPNLEFSLDPNQVLNDLFRTCNFFEPS